MSKRIIDLPKGTLFQYRTDMHLKLSHRSFGKALNLRRMEQVDLKGWNCDWWVDKEVAKALLRSLHNRINIEIKKGAEL